LITKHRISITSNKLLTCLQLVFTSNWSNFCHAFALPGFVSDSWAFLSFMTCICVVTANNSWRRFVQWHDGISWAFELDTAWNEEVFLTASQKNQRERSQSHHFSNQWMLN